MQAPAQAPLLDANKAVRAFSWPMPGANTASNAYSRFFSFQMWSSVSSSGMLRATCAVVS